MNKYKKGIFFNISMAVSLFLMIFFTFITYNKLTTKVGSINASLGPGGIIHYSLTDRLYSALPIFLLLVCICIAFISCVVQSYSSEKKYTRLVGLGVIAMLYLLITLLTDYGRFSWYKSSVYFIPILLFLFLLIFYLKSFISTFPWKSETRVLIISLAFIIIALAICYLLARNYYCHLYNVCDYFDNLIYKGYVGGSMSKGFFPF